MPRNSEQSHFVKGVAAGYRKIGHFLSFISSELNISKSTAAFVIKKWKVSVNCQDVYRHNIQAKLRDRDRQVLSKEIQKPPPLRSMGHILQEFQQVSGTVVSINVIHKEAHLLGFNGRAAIHQPLITKYDSAVRLRRCKALQNCTLG
ncbi:transposable element Tc1 transposase [Trichonephila clavipes]|nr:transposable element Tc1 transposase [Trichonephila clavipes]